MSYIVTLCGNDTTGRFVCRSSVCRGLPPVSIVDCEGQIEQRTYSIDNIRSHINTPAVMCIREHAAADTILLNLSLRHS